MNPPPLPLNPQPQPSLPADADAVRALLRCANLCVGAGLFVLAGGLLVEFGHLPGVRNRPSDDLTVLMMVSFWDLLAIGAGVRLRQRRKDGETLAMLTLIPMLIAIPVGTILGAMGIVWLRKGVHLLR